MRLCGSGACKKGRGGRNKMPEELKINCIDLISIFDYYILIDVITIITYSMIR
jgi:hypothetical protein